MSMFFCGTWRLTSDEEPVILRIDADPDEKVAIYAITDRTGTIHRAKYPLEGLVEDLQDLANLSLLAYLNYISLHGWVGRCDLVLAPLDTEFPPWEKLQVMFKEQDLQTMVLQ